MKSLVYISLVLLLACEQVIKIELPTSQNLVVIEGWVSDVEEHQSIRITRSNAFDDENPIPLITDAQVIIESGKGKSFLYRYDSNGYYRSNIPYRGVNGVAYRLRVVIDEGVVIKSRWDEMPRKIPIENLEINSFRENDPDNPGLQTIVFYPKVTVMDLINTANYYRWIFFKNNNIFNESESITIQRDRLFDGNFIPNDFKNFGFTSGDTMTVQLISISQNTYYYLSFLKSQITKQGTSLGITPAIVKGNLSYLDNEDQLVLGYFGTNAISERTVNIP